MSSVFPQFVTLQKTSRKNWNIQQKTAVLLSNRENGCIILLYGYFLPFRLVLVTALEGVLVTAFVGWVATALVGVLVTALVG